MTTRVVVLFDSITNSVFEGQTLQMLKRTAHHYSNTIIISFEKQHPPLSLITAIENTGFTCVIKKKLPFFIQEQLLMHSIWLKYYLRKIGNHVLFARGPHAGYIMLNARNKNTWHLLIQARGLCAEEYRFFYPQKEIIQQIRYWTMHRLEKWVYSFKDARLTVEAVSPALRTYLIHTFHTPANIVIAQDDIPQSIDPVLRAQWRAEIREKLSLTQEQEVYCYNGSAKPWQCAEESIKYFKNVLRSNDTAHLLILSAEKEYFRSLCNSQLPKKSYSILTTQHKDIYRYLATADFGILLRKNHVVNWVSRPTKWLEYKAVGLKIIHNQTIASLQDEGL